MKNLIRRMTDVFPDVTVFNLSLLIFRVAVSLQLMVAHGLKKIGIGVPNAEQVPNPLHLPEAINQGFAVASNLVFPLFVMFGLLTRVAILPILAVTLTGYFVVHWNDSLLEKDMPFMYSLAFLLLFVIGPGKYAVDYWLNKNLYKKL
jgi:putative oxidoreductase